MNKKELYTLMVLIQAYYEKFQFDQQKLDAWHMVLQKYTYERVHEQLLNFVVDSPHPPKISDLVQNTSWGRDIPRDFVLDLTDN
ncbi:replicative helicase loader/inhibitor [Neobacillus sp. DY30]|uniref:replicative helicase loader/inhibitor n=1 Tax=Neobacillus sp. DY30 TaxID=3047871 RepID=UPI0024C0935A|nr:replicative helicase loader/inhibitor [Neobacillus sp. DY30]WHY03428.1 replicative helicase loader/inhibitor [Neobacillus sp. DY30]